MRTRFLTGCLWVLLASAVPAGAQLTVDALEAEHPDGTLYRFPLFGGDARASARINTFLQSRILEQEPGCHDDNPFEDVWPDEGSHNGLVALDYTIAFEQPGILAVEIDQEFYGAYLSVSVDRFHFDARTGRPIELPQLLRPEGRARLDREIRESRLRKIDEFLAGKPVGGTRLRSDPAEAEEQAGLYRACRARIEASSPVSADALRLGRHSFALVPEPCGPQAVRALLDLDLSIDRSYEGVAADLEDYGRCLLLERRARCSRGDAEAGTGH